jgi:hypothetical protein
MVVSWLDLSVPPEVGWQQATVQDPGHPDAPPKSQATTGSALPSTTSQLPSDPRRTQVIMP